MILGVSLERAKRFELSTSTLARLPSTTELYPNIWCLGTESTRRHRDFQSLALPTELPRQDMATRKGLEPSTSSVTGWRTNHLYYRATIWWTFRDLNPGQTGYEPVALTN